MFFVTWKLWEQMTFVLGLAILMVFAIGYAKLLYTNRLVKKQEVVDEEKRVRISELRSSGQIVESRRSHDIPFGVRAIQSGIQVDGIWISQGSTPVPSELKLENIRGSSSEVLDTLESSREAQKSYETTPELRPLSRQDRSPYRVSEGPAAALDKVHEASDLDRPTSAGTRASYKPRRSSHLRQGSHGQYDAETLSQLESNSPGSKRRVISHRPRSSRQLDVEPDSSAADNEGSSAGGTSSESEASLSHKGKGPAGSSPQSYFSNQNVRHATPLRTSHPTSAPATLPPFSDRNYNTKYPSIPLDSPNLEASDPFATPSMTPGAMTPTSRAPSTSAWPQDYEGLPVQASRPPSPFIPGELHVNKSVRKVNSGFEVLPAGTFGVPPEFKRGGELGDDEDDSGERRQSKLQKKHRTSMTGRRASSTIER